MLLPSSSSIALDDQVWSVPTPLPECILHGHTAPVTAIMEHQGLLLSASEDGCIRVWDLMRLACVHVLSAHSEGVTCLAASSAHVFSAGRSSTLKVSFLHFHKHYPASAWARINCMYLRNQVWNPEAWTPVAICETISPITCQLVLPGNWLVTGRKDGEIICWNPVNWSFQRVWPHSTRRCHDKSVTCLASMPGLFISGSEDTYIKVHRFCTLPYSLAE
jgi:WD40 repeat protein